VDAPPDPLGGASTAPPAGASPVPAGVGAAGPATAAALSQRDIRGIFVGICLAMFLASLDQTIVATAMPTIGRDLHDLEHLPWVVTAYLLASTAVTPLYGKFSDMHGRRVTLLIAIAVFLLGSIACAMAPTMLGLVVARALQGMGGGGLIALAQTIIADMVTPRERGRYQVWIASVFATSALAGPVLGGFIAETLHWSLIFWINLPLGFVTLWLTNSRLKRLPRFDRRHRLDVLGAVLMTGATVSLMLALSQGGVRLVWSSPQILLLLATSAVLWCAFVWRIATASEPLVTPAILVNRVVSMAIPASACGMGTFIGLTIFVPIFFEASLGFSARQSGLALIPFMIGMTIGATVSGRAMASFRHYKRLPTFGVALSALAVGALAFVGRDWPFWIIEVLLTCASLGLGTLMPVTTVSIQNAVERHQLGTATAAMNFFRQLGGAMIVAGFGAIAFGGGVGHGLTLETLQGGGADLSGTFRGVFTAAAIGLVATFCFLLAMEERPLQEKPAGAPEPVA
jgi:EmrB/QacA subfamily drug resistance transporter